MDRPAYLPETLTQDQLKAILHHGSPLLIIAGPGSGKTEVVTWRVVHAVRTGHAPPGNLLVTTFTNKAADQLKDRIQARLPGVNVESMHISTIHAFCAGLLRDFAAESPLPRGFRVLDAEGQLLYVYARRKELGLDDLVKGRPHAFFSSVISL